VTGPWHAVDAASVATELGVDPAAGLTAVEAERRSATQGPNALEASRRDPVWRMVLDAFTEPFVLMLAGAGLLAIIVGEVRDGLLVLVGLLPIVGADVVTEYRGERALEALRDATAPMARARRDGRVATVAAASLVTGDVILLQGGDVVPADLRLTRADRLLLDRSVLTGESIPEEARVDPDAADAPLTGRRSIAYSGTSVVGGRGEGIVVAIGAGTEFGRIAGSLATRERRRSPLQRELALLQREFFELLGVGQVGDGRQLADTFVEFVVLQHQLPEVVILLEPRGVRVIEWELRVCHAPPPCKPGISPGW